jgi:single-stranded-DNA-specific exonuclease
MVKSPDRKTFLRDLEAAVEHFIDHSKSGYNNIVIISHNDADGISSLQIIQNLLHKMKINNDYFIYNRSTSWENYLNGILPRHQSTKSGLIFTDVGSTLSDLLPIIKEREEHFYILDHHEVESQFDYKTLPENLHFINPTIYGFDGLDHIAGATLTHMFATSIDPTLLKYGWLTVIGIVGDSLRSMDKLQSFNKEIYQEIIEEEIVEDNRGVILFGSMHDTVKNSLKNSILPFVPGFSGESDLHIKTYLNNIQVDPNKKLNEIDDIDLQKLLNLPKLEMGNYAILPFKLGMLKYAFEHALLLNILSFKNISAALSIMQQKSITRYAKSIYNEYVSNLAVNMKKLSNDLSKFETDKAIFIDAGNGKIPPSNWSDTASFSMVNELIDPNKILFLGGLEKKTQMIKLSIRCSKKFIEDHKNGGVNSVITNIKHELGGNGGGHKLAGGIRLSQASFKYLKQNIDNYF